MCSEFHPASPCATKHLQRRDPKKMIPVSLFQLGEFYNPMQSKTVRNC